MISARRYEAAWNANHTEKTKQKIKLYLQTWRTSHNRDGETDSEIEKSRTEHYEVVTDQRWWNSSNPDVTACNGKSQRKAYTTVSYEVSINKLITGPSEWSTSLHRRPLSDQQDPKTPNNFFIFLFFLQNEMNLHCSTRRRMQYPGTEYLYFSP